MRIHCSSSPSFDESLHFLLILTRRNLGSAETFPFKLRVVREAETDPIG